MGASRKLQGEIDRVLKKVQEGVDVFDSIWNKVYDTDNANQKEKFEADLKKEIKKLQRYRDQIKTWIQSSEIKDKKVSASYEQALMDARKLIEREMERFKICEKETKTKAFSKEGLGQQPKTDPKEKAKSETRDWLNNTVSELESQIDSFEAEMEGLSVKKGKARPPRLTHLESSIVRHKAHIMKLELILRLLDNDELSPEQVNDVKDFIDDYVERNQEDFDEFEDVDMLYNTLSLDKVEALEDLVIIGPPGLVKGVGASVAVLSTKNALSSPPVQSPGASVQEQTEETLSQENISEHGPRTPPPKAIAISSSPPTPSGTHATTPITVPTPSHNLTASSVPPSPSPVRGVLDNSVSTIPSSPINKEEEVGGFPVRKSSPALSESGLRNLGRGSLTSLTSLTSQSSVTLPINPTNSNIISTNNALGVSQASELAKRPMLGTDERMVQQHPPVSSLSSRIMLPQSGVKTSDGDNGNGGEGGGMGTRVFSPSGVPGIQWRPGSSFQTQHEGGQFRGRTEIAPDQREKFLQRFQQVQQQGSSTLLGMPPISGGTHKQFSTQQNPLLQQFNSQSSSGLGGAPPASPNTATSAQQQNLIHLQSSQQMSTVSKDSEINNSKVEEMEQQQQQQSVTSDDSAPDPAQSPVLNKNTSNEEDPKVSYALDMQGSGTMTEAAQSTRDVDLSPGQPLQSNQSVSLGVIGRRSLSDLGAIGDNLSGLAVSLGGTHDQQYNLQMLESAFYKLPQPRDSERAKSYTARHPAVTPQSYPQVQAPIVNNPAFWERLGSDNIGTDTLFFAFYYQQNAYQQYLAAKELKKQSWRYHKKYNTWFQRHEEPKFATDDYEQGTYVYFDFHIGNDEMQNGWCQRIKTDFKFEYNFLEDELIV
ncbi:uncharacterized protein LOC111893291 isoform X1 [Lactuca sativa]|uniref:uncharacterized protein LOC111893291 isoform X1 n=1 Tax=Lactuca sativa TaxID=4236 RepID=UPI000CD90AF4|nr:uncharacterized protein LOC111893291 isoform X1 [Lactuca sativa]